MFDPKKVFSEDGYDQYRAHIKNIEEGLFYIKNNADDLHIGALDITQQDDLYTICEKFEKLIPVLKKGDGETYE